MNKELLIYIFAVSVVAFIAYGIDKYKATHNQWRIPEKTLILLAAIGGSLGALAGMQIFHHKTRKPKFKYGVPTILVIQVILLGYAKYKGII